MGIQINGNTDTISAIDGGLNVSGASLGSASASSLNISGIVTASGGFSGNVSGNVNSTGLSTFSSGVIIAAGTTSAPSISPSGDSNTGIFFPSPDTVAIAEGGVEALRVDSSANIGIGTAISLSKVHIQGTGNGSSGSTGLNDSSAASSLLLKPLIGSGTALSLGTRNTGGHYIQGLYAASSVESVRDIQINPYGGSVGIGTFADAFGGVPGSSTFVVATTGLERLRIDSSGRLTLPYQPAFFARPPGGYDIVGGGNIISGTWSETYDRSNSFSNGTFTAPVSGWYCLSWNVFLASETTRQDAYILVNGTEIMREEINGYTGTFNRSVSVHGSYQLAANDAVTYGVYSTAGITLYSSQNPWGYACGFLIG